MASGSYVPCSLVMFWPGRCGGRWRSAWCLAMSLHHSRALLLKRPVHSAAILSSFLPTGLVFSSSLGSSVAEKESYDMIFYIVYLYDRLAWFVNIILIFNTFVLYLHSYPTNEGKHVRGLSLFRLTGSRATSAHASRLGEVQLGPCCGSEDNQTRLFLNFIH